MNRSELLKKYPFLKVRGMDGKIIKGVDWSEQIPDGWRIAFGSEMIERISQVLKKANFEKKYIIIQIKEKFAVF